MRILSFNFSGWVFAMLGVMLFATGCAPKTRVTSPKTDGTAPLGNRDPCASRLHDYCGSFLMYVAVKGRLPDTLDQLNRLPGMEPLEFVCPVSGKDYVYNPNGIMLPEQNARIILYDPAPSHMNYRWAVIAVDKGDQQPMVTKVIALPESFFLLRPPH